MTNRKTNELTIPFYQQVKWRTYHHRKSSMDKFTNRIEEVYRKHRTIFYGDWSSSNQQKGCKPSPTVKLRKLISRRLETVSVSNLQVCNLYRGGLTRYRNRRVMLSHSRLWSLTCTLNGKPKFVNRDRNAAAGILLVGESIISKASPKHSREYLYS